MLAGGTTEAIWHFIGDLKLFRTADLDGIEYDPFARRKAAPDERAPLSPDGLPQYDPPAANAPAMRVRMPQGEGEGAAVETVGQPLADAAGASPGRDGGAPSREAFLPGPVGSGSGVSSIPKGAPPYRQGYEDGGQDKIVDIRQANRLDDDDRLLPASGADAAEFRQIDPADELRDLVATARDLQPDGLASGEVGALAWTDLAARRHGALASGEASPSDAEPGHYRDGTRVEAPPEGLEARGGEAPSGASLLSTGANAVRTAAVIGDLNETAGTLIVVGDYFATSAIVQVNVLRDRDGVLPQGEGAGRASDALEANRTDNVASLIREDFAGSRGAGAASSGLSVRIEVAEGDLFDVKALTQRNWLSDDDSALHAITAYASEVWLGGNIQANGARFLDTAQYDVIVTMGDYHDVDIILQTNVLLDDDVLGAAGAGGSARSGGNVLLNEAGILRIGDPTGAALPDTLARLAAALDQRLPVDRDAWSGLAGTADGRLDVLVVRGDYWDINVIAQTNVVSDADAAFADGGQVATGGNLVHNEARIVDAGGLFDRYVGGTQYVDALIIQADYVDARATVIDADTATLINEAIAFSGLTDPPGEMEALTAMSRAALPHEDPMSAIMA